MGDRFMIDEPEATGDARDEYHSTMALTKHRLPRSNREEQEGTDEIGVDDLSEGFRLQSMWWSQCDGPNGMHHTLRAHPLRLPLTTAWTVVSSVASPSWIVMGR